MAALTVNTDRRASGDIRTQKLKADQRPFQGAFIGLDSNGFARALVAGDLYMGVNRQRLPEAPTADGGSKTEIVSGLHRFWQKTVTGATGLSDIGTKVYASSDNDLTTTSTSNSLVGSIAGYDAALGFEIVAMSADVRAAV